MEDQKKSNNIVSNMWRNWCQLDPAQRTQVADRLGPLGHMLSIAANVTAFAQRGTEVIADAGSSGESAEGESQPNREPFAEDDIIDAEFEECEP